MHPIQSEFKKLLEFYFKGVFPRYICYDNSCQLHRFCTNRKRTDKSRFLDEEIFIIDRLHVQDHVEQGK